jgi:hypothetical protein
LLSQIFVAASGATDTCRSAPVEVDARGPVAGLPGIAPERLPGFPVPESIDRTVTRGVPRGSLDPLTLLAPMELEVPEGNVDLPPDLNEVRDPLDCRLVLVEA